MATAVAREQAPAVGLQGSPTVGPEGTGPNGQLVAQRDAPLGGQAVLEGVMMRGVAHWAVAVRKPPPGSANGDGRPGATNGDGPAADPAAADPTLGEIEVTSFPLDSALRRHRALRLPIVRGVVALGESLAIGFRALEHLRQRAAPRGGARGAHERRGRGGGGLPPGDPPGAVGGHRGARDRARGRPVLPAPRGPDEPDPQRPRRLLGGSSGRSRGWCARRSSSATCSLLSRVRDLRRVFEYHGAEHKTISCYEARARADARERAALLAPAPALRHELPAGRDDRGDLRVRPDRPAALVLARGDAHPRRAGDRGDLLRAHQVRRAQPPPRAGCGR